MFLYEINVIIHIIRQVSVGTYFYDIEIYGEVLLLADFKNYIISQWRTCGGR